MWHSAVAALEVDVQDLEKPEEVLILTERLVEVQQLHSLLAKQAEQRTSLISKVLCCCCSYYTVMLASSWRVTHVINYTQSCG